VELEHLSVTIHPRANPEAIDLGLRMVQSHAHALFPPWILVVAGSALALALALPGHPLLALASFWLALPLFDRLVVHVLSHALFADTPGWRETLAALPRLARDLSLNPLNRIDFTRSFNLPVIQLEALPRPRRARRIRLLQRETRSQAVWLSLAFLAFEWILVIGILSLPSLLLPEGTLKKLHVELIADGSDGQLAMWALYAAYVIAVLFLEPFYIGAGFSLYLNRRAMLEAWDLEIGLRKIARRITAASGLWLVLALLAGGFTPPPVSATMTTTEKDAPRIIEEVLSDPVFGHLEKTTRWRYRPDPAAPDSPPPGLLEWLLNSHQAGALFASIARLALWLLFAAAIAWLIWRREHWLRWVGARRARARQDSEPLVVAGVDVSPDSLPEDIPRAVQALWNEQRYREAMSLLYRGTLAALIEQRQLAVDASSTEQDCIEAVEQLDIPALSRHFRDLTTLWQLLAYGHRLPDTRLVEHLCRQWRKLYRSPGA